MKNSRYPTILLYLIFLLSGTSCLISEVAWNRMLVLLVGNTVSASSLIVISFMAGLSLGSFYGGRFLQNRQATILPYIICEVVIGLFIFISPDFFSLITRILSFLAPFPPIKPLIHLIRFLIVTIYLIAPTFFMGATFPAIVHSISWQPSPLQAKRTGYLYGTNTIGAALGCFCAGYILLPRLGTRSTLSCAILLNIISVAGALILTQISMRNGKKMIPLHTSSILKPHSSHHLIFDYYALIISLVGFITISYQILMIRIIILLFGNQVEVFSFVVSAFLAAIGLSAIISTHFQKFERNRELFFIYVVLISGALLILMPFLLAGLPSMGFRWILGRWGFQLMIWLIVLMPIFIMAALLPTAIRICAHERKEACTFSAGKLYAANTCGGILGAGIANYYLVPLFGIQTTLNFFALILVGFGLLGLWKQRTPRIPKGIGIIAFLFFAMLLAGLPEKIKEIYISVITNRDGSPSQIKLFHEGRSATITVLDTKHDSRRLFLNGVEEVTSRFYHIQLFKTLGLLPVLLHESDQPKNILVIAFGAGISSGAALDSGQGNTVHALDINPDIKGISQLFHEANGHVYQNPRFEFIPADGRNYLILTPEKYSVIISDATHPFAYDSWVLYTKEFYEAVKARLEDQGVFAQWLPLTITDEFFAIFLKTFCSVFPHSTFWNIPGSDQAFILATPKPFLFDLQLVQDRLNRIPPSAKLSVYDLDQSTNLASFFVLDTPAIRALSKDERRINSDNLPYNHRFHFRTSSDEPQLIALYPYQSSILPYLVNAKDYQIEKIIKLQKRSSALQKYFYCGGKNFLYQAAGQYPADKLVQSYLGQAPRIYSWDAHIRDK